MRMKEAKTSHDALLRQIGRNMRICRRRAGYRAGTAAELLELTERTLCAYERAEHEMTLRTAVSIAMLYRTTLSKMLGYKTEGRKSTSSGKLIYSFKVLRKRLGYTQTEFAAEIGISKATLSKYENKQPDISICTFYVLCEKCGLDEKGMDELARAVVIFRG